MSCKLFSFSHRDISDSNRVESSCPLKRAGYASVDRFVRPTSIILASDTLLNVREYVHEMARPEFLHVRPVRLGFALMQVFRIGVEILSVDVSCGYRYKLETFPCSCTIGIEFELSFRFTTPSN